MVKDNATQIGDAHLRLKAPEMKVHQHEDAHGANVLITLNVKRSIHIDDPTILNGVVIECTKAEAVDYMKTLGRKFGLL